MSASKKISKYNKYGFSTSKKKLGINYWRFFFNGLEKNSGSECLFYIEFEMLNPWTNPAEATLGFKPRVQIKEEDLQYALSGTAAARDIKTEEIVEPSYVAVRVGKLCDSPKQLVQYMALNQIRFNVKPFEIHAENNIFTESELSGFVSVSLTDKNQHSEYFCDCGSANWNLQYEVINEYEEGMDNGTDKWFPSGMRTAFTGIINFDGQDYIVDPTRCGGYIDRYWGKTFPEQWFHVSSCNLSSLISGKTLTDSTFAIHGIFNDDVCFLGNFEGAEILFAPNGPVKNFQTVWNCVESPEADEDGDRTIHWSVSISSKLWVIDIDIFSKIKYLYNKKMECPEGNRKVINILQSGTGYGEIKLYKKIKNDLEQIEFAQITKAFCEFGHVEESEQ